MTVSITQPGLAHTGATDRSGLLRLALKLDAVATGALAVLGLAAAPLLESFLGTPASLLYPIGLFLLVYAVAVWIIGTRPQISRSAAWGVVALNLVWVAASVATVLAGWLPLTTLGTAFVLLQAVAVLVFADLQYLGLRRARTGAA